MTKIKFRSIQDQISKIYNKEEKKIDLFTIRLEKSFDFSKFTSIDNFNLPLYNSLDDECKNKFYNSSEKVIFKCPCCNFLQTANYDTLYRSATTDHGFCINNKCKYFLKNKKYGIFDVAYELIKYNTVVQSEYVNCKTPFKTLCLKCKVITDLTLQAFQNNYYCKNCMIDDGEIKYRRKQDYEFLIKKNGFEIIGDIPTKERDYVLLKCNKNHKFGCFVYVFKDRLITGKICDQCVYLEQYYKYKKILIDSGISIILNKDEELFNNDGKEKVNVSQIDFEFKCLSEKHLHCYKIGRIIEDIDEYNMYSCFKCNNCKDDLIKEKCEKMRFTNAKYNAISKKIEFNCRCGILNTAYLSLFLKDSYQGCNTCSHSNPEIVYKMIYGENIQKYDVYKMTNDETIHVQGSEGECFDYLLKTYKREELILAKELFYNYSDLAKQYIDKSEEKKLFLEQYGMKLPIPYGNNQSYYPDGYIPKTNTIIECKSSGVDFPKINKLIYGCLKQNYNVMLLQYSDNIISEYKITPNEIDSYKCVVEKTCINKIEVENKIKPVQYSTKSNPVCQFDKKNKFINKYNSIDIACHTTGDTINWIKKMADNNGKYEYKKKHENKFIWKYETKYNEELKNKEELKIDSEDIDTEEIEDSDTEEDEIEDDGVQKWAIYKNAVKISSLGNVINNKTGNSIKVHFENSPMFCIDRKDFHLGKVMAIAFKIEDWDKLETDKTYTTHFKDNVYKLENLSIITQSKKKLIEKVSKSDVSLDSELLNKYKNDINLIDLLKINDLKHTGLGLKLLFNSRIKKQDLINMIKDKLKN